jgi:hypothetical protein
MHRFNFHLGSSGLPKVFNPERNHCHHQQHHQLHLHRLLILQVQLPTTIDFREVQLLASQLVPQPFFYLLQHSSTSSAAPSPTKT